MWGGNGDDDAGLGDFDLAKPVVDHDLGHGPLLPDLGAQAEELIFLSPTYKSRKFFYPTEVHILRLSMFQHLKEE